MIENLVEQLESADWDIEESSEWSASSNLRKRVREAALRCASLPPIQGRAQGAARSLATVLERAAVLIRAKHGWSKKDGWGNTTPGVFLPKITERVAEAATSALDADGVTLSDVPDEPRRK